MRTRRRRAQALIEFAVVLPVVLLCFYAIFDVSRLMFTQLSLDSGAQAAARLLATNAPGLKRGEVYRAVTRYAPAVRVPANALRYKVLTGPEGKPWVEVELRSQYELLAGSFVTRAAWVQLSARARAPIDLAAGEGVRLP